MLCHGREIARKGEGLDDVAFVPLVLTKKESHPFSTGDSRYVRVVTQRVGQATCACSRDRSVSVDEMWESLASGKHVNAGANSRDPVSFKGFVAMYPWGRQETGLWCP